MRGLNMSRNIKIHHLSDLNAHIKITADEKADGGASHLYVMKIGDNEQYVKFQQGALKEAGLNGISDESLLAIVIDRLRGFQAGPFSCRENALALTKLEEGLLWLNARTLDRMTRGVEGVAKA